MLNFFDFVGIVGAITIAFFYFYSQYRYTFLNTFQFFVGNIIGSTFIISSLLMSNFNLASFGIAQSLKTFSYKYRPNISILSYILWIYLGVLQFSDEINIFAKTSLFITLLAYCYIVLMFFVKKEDIKHEIIE